MKRKELLRYLKVHDCVLVKKREKAQCFYELAEMNNKVLSVPRHTEINDFLARKSAVIWE